LNDGLGSESEPIPCKQDNHVGIITNYQCARLIPRLQGGVWERGTSVPHLAQFDSWGSVFLWNTCI